MKKKTAGVVSTRVPIYPDAAFQLDNLERITQAFQQEQDNLREPENYIYSRYRNPTVTGVEEKIMELESCRWALLTQSGMSAIDVALSIFQKGGDTGTWLFFSEIYGGTNSYIDRVLKFRRGIAIEHFYPDNSHYDLAQLEKALATIKPGLVFFEAISNPMLMVSDCEAIIAMARKAGAAVLVDNTFATPYLWNPLEMGADIVIHSATKYLAGHNNITAGVVCGNDRHMGKDGVEYRKYVGHMLSPGDAYRLETQLSTFKIRFKKHCENASRLAAVLTRHPRVETVLFPGLQTHPTHGAAKKLFKGKGYGGMITFDLKGDTGDRKSEAARRFIDKVAPRIVVVPTLGDTRTFLLPVEAVWGEKYPMPGMIRLSVGIEEYEQLESAVLNGLD